MKFYETMKKFGIELKDYLLAQDIHKIYRERRHVIRKNYKGKPVKKNIRIATNRANEYVRQLGRFAPYVVELLLGYDYITNGRNFLESSKNWCYTAGI